MSFTTSYFSSAMKFFKQFMSFWHSVTSKQECNISSQETRFVELGFTRYNTSKMLYSIFQGSPWFLFISGNASKKCFGKYLLYAILSIFKKNRRNFLVWIKTCTCIWFVPEWGTYGKWLKKKQDLLSGSSYLSSLTTTKKLFSTCSLVDLNVLINATIRTIG